MKIEKFEIEITTLKRFFELYCNNKHKCQKSRNANLEYKDKTFCLDLNLCEECHDAINYSFKRLDQCQHDEKPRCRNCPTPCYEKQRWKNAAKVMKYSAIKLSLSKVKQKVKNFFS